MCTWPPGERQVCFECTHRHDKCLIHGESVKQHVPCGSGPKKKKARVISQPVIEEVNEEMVVAELTRKEVTPEEVNIEATAPEEGPVVNVPPCLEELVWATLQEGPKMHESAKRREHFEYGIWGEMCKLVGDPQGKGSFFGTRERHAGGCLARECHGGEVPGAGEGEKKG